MLTASSLLLIVLRSWGADLALTWHLSDSELSCDRPLQKEREKKAEKVPMGQQEISGMEVTLRGSTTAFKGNRPQ